MERALQIPANSFIIQIHPDGSHCALITKSSCQFHSLKWPTAVRILPGALRGTLRSAAFSSDGRWLAVTDLEHLELWDLTSQGPGVSVDQARDSYLFFSGADELFASGPKGSFRWRLEPGGPKAVPTLHRVNLPQIPENSSFCPLSNNILLTTYQGSTLVPLENPIAASVPSGQAWVPTPRGLNGVSPDGRWAAIFTPFDNELHIYRLPGLDVAATLTNRAEIRTFEFSPRGDELAVTSRGHLEFWSTKTWERTHELTNVLDILYSPNGAGWWLTRDYRSGGLYDSHSGQPLLPLPTGTLPIAVSPDGRYLAASVDSRYVEVWDLAEVRLRLRELGMDWQDN